MSHNSSLDKIHPLPLSYQSLHAIKSCINWYAWFNSIFTFKQWRRYDVKYKGQGQSGQAIKLFRRLEKLFSPSIFYTGLSCLMTWNLRSYPTTVVNEKMWYFRGSIHTLTPPTYFHGSRSQPAGSMPLLSSNLSSTLYIAYRQPH